MAANASFCLVCLEKDAEFAFKCCYRDISRLCKGCIESIVIHMIVKDIDQGMEIDTTRPINVRCPFCRQEYEAVYDINVLQMNIEEIINIPQIVKTATTSRRHYMQKIREAEANVRTRANERWFQRRARLAREVLAPLSRLINAEYRRRSPAADMDLFDDLMTANL